MRIRRQPVYGSAIGLRRIRIIIIRIIIRHIDVGKGVTTSRHG